MLDLIQTSRLATVFISQPIPLLLYCNVPKYSKGQVWVNSIHSDQKEQYDQCLHDLPFSRHLLDTLLYGKDTR